MDDLLGRLDQIGDTNVSAVLFRKESEHVTGHVWSAAMHVGREEPAEFETVSNDECPHGYPHDSSWDGEWYIVDGAHHKHLISSPMIGGAGYGHGDTPAEALSEVLAEFRL